MKNILSKFNKPEAILVVTSFPSTTNGTRELTAVAWHSKRTLMALAKKGTRMVVLAEKIPASAENETITHCGKNILVIRAWEKGSIKSLFQIAKWSLSFSAIHNTLFQFEFNIFGGILPVFFLPFLLIFFRLIGKSITFELHQVLSDLSAIATHINVKNNGILKAFNVGLAFFYFAIGTLASSIIVFESRLKTRLAPYVKSKKIHVIPLAVSPRKITSKENARHALGFSKKDLVIMSFGFVNWYKGSDWITKTVSNMRMKNVRLVMAGGESTTFKDKRFYQKFYRDVERIAEKNNRITLTGFIPDRQIGRYFAAADICVLPYRVFMSASGPLAQALSYQKPILFSENLNDYFQSDDMRRALKKSNLVATDVIFKLNSRHFTQKIRHAKENIEDFTEFSKLLGNTRNIDEIASRYNRLLFSNTPQGLLPTFRVLMNEK
ncbi:hypothetical protein A3D80_02715 [Candidatus Roizmanbacteria bacterium RIFCSPHIGHO2_02_FULL_40_13b]|nr:MAG: hypothetical protein A3D80_02715 [Candidatus Roizmanbacteria bacterium RIFCSPHIGHO2_02_FULL_40_13b]